MELYDCNCCGQINVHSGQLEAVVLQFIKNKEQDLTCINIKI